MRKAGQRGKSGLASRPSLPGSHPLRVMSKTDPDCRDQATRTEGQNFTGNQPKMAEVVIVYWRDIPAQVIAGKGRRGAKKQLAERFEQAIDRCAMKIGAKDADAYLAEWRKAPPYEVEGEQEEVAAAVTAQLEAEYDTERLKALIANEGWAKA